jgi:putative transposase
MTASPPQFRSYRRRLPHWRSVNACYFVTWRLGPEQPDLTPSQRAFVLDALRHQDAKKYALHACVVMNDHVHALLTPLGTHQLEGIVRAWKSFTSRKMERGLRVPGGCWQAEYFDRIIRDEAELMEKAQYIRNNPRKRWPDLEDYPWVWAVGENTEAPTAGLETRHHRIGK